MVKPIISGVDSGDEVEMKKRDISKFRRVRPGWYTMTFIDPETAYKEDRDELYVDVSYREKYGDWCVSTRSDEFLDTERGYVTDFADIKTAKTYAKDYGEWLVGRRMTRPKLYEYV